MLNPAPPETRRSTPDTIQSGPAAEASPLQPFLTLQPPAPSDHTPPVLSFRRKRRVDVPWDEILGRSAATGVTSIGAIREYFESSWGLGAIDKTTWPPATQGNTARIKALQTAGLDAKGKPVPLPMYRAVVQGDAGTEAGAAAAEKVDAGLIVQHGISGRWYLMVSRSDEPLSAADLASLATCDTLWKDKVDGVELVFETPQAAAGGATKFSEVDLRPAVVHRAYKALLIHKEFVDAVSASAATVTRNAVDKLTSESLDIDELQRLQQRSFQLQMQAYDAQRRLDQLVSQAADLGYYLFPVARDFTFPGGAKPTKVEPGQIYTQIRRTATWVTTHHRNVTRATGWWIFKGSKTVRQAYTQTNAQVVTDYQKVDTSRDALVDAVAQRRAKGMAVFVFELGPLGFVTRDGTPLREVMAQCDRNEAFRTACVVMLPVVEESLTGTRVLTKYSVFERPLPGISPSALPQFSLLESLSYRTAWLQSQLGELVSTINLAPGEERTVVMSKVFEQESTVTRSSTSIFDVNRSDSSDLASEMENQARQESEHSSNMNFSAKASGSYGLFSAEASASGGSSNSLKSFGQAISKVARKASQAVNQQNREEVSTSSSVKTTVAHKDDTSATLRNVNQGRTLNLLFHRVNNRFRGGIYLDELQFEVIPGTEVIGGSGVYESLRYTLDELPQMIEQFGQTRLPFDLIADDADPTPFLAQVVASLKALLEQEYMAGAAPPAPQASSRAARGGGRALPSEATTVTATSVARLNLGPPAAAVPALKSARRGGRASAFAGGPGSALGAALGAAQAELADFVARLKGATVDRDTAILGDDLILASGGLYMDAMVGVQASTEPYSEAMRAQEVRQREADVQKTLAEAAWQRALAANLRGDAASGARDNVVVGLVRDGAHKALQVQVRRPLEPGQWDLLIDGSRKGTSPVQGPGQRTLAYQWPRAQAWFKDDDLEHRIVLEERETQRQIVFETA